MSYIHRVNGKIVGLSRWPNGSAEQLSDDNPEVIAFRNPPPAPSREEILANVLDNAPNDTARWAAMTAHLRGNG